MVVQDKTFPDFSDLFKKYGVQDYSYIKIHYLHAKGVGHARAKAQEVLTNDYKYYFQIDSHTRFTQNWDTKAILDHEHLSKIWGTCVLSTYPPEYRYNEDNSITTFDGYVPIIKVLEKDNFAKITSDYLDGDGIDLSDGYLTGYIAAGQLFGLTSDILKVKYDPEVYFWGEEQTLSIRMHANGINVLCPPQNYVFHDYNGEKRVRHWHSDTIWAMYQSRSHQHIREFFQGKQDVGLNVIKEYMEKFLHKELPA